MHYDFSCNDRETSTFCIKINVCQTAARLLTQSYTLPFIALPVVPAENIEWRALSGYPLRWPLRDRTA